MKTAEVHTFVRSTPSIGIMFLASALASRVHDRVCLSHLDSPEGLSHLDEPVKVEAQVNAEDLSGIPVTLKSEAVSEALSASEIEDQMTMAEPETAPAKVATVLHDEPVSARDFKTAWDLETAKDAFAALEASGLSKTAFAKANGFGVDRFKRWADRV